MTVVGRLERVEIGMGAWVVVTPDGRRLQLNGEVPESLAGRNVVATGTVQQSHGFGMLDVESTVVLSAPLRAADD